MINFSAVVLIMLVIGTKDRFTGCNPVSAIPGRLCQGFMAGLPGFHGLKQSSLIRGSGTSPFYLRSSPESGGIRKNRQAFPTTSAAGPYAKVRIEIPQANTLYECAWDDSAWFPDYIDSLWNYDFNAFLVSLGRFLISWGDGQQDTIRFFHQSCSHIYAAAGHYMITVFSMYAFFNDEAVTVSGNLYSLKNLNFANCPNLHDAPVLTGLSLLQVLDLRATGITASPVIKGLTGLQYLYFNGTAIAKPPDLTTNINLKYISFHGCNALAVKPLVSKLSLLEHLDLYGTLLSGRDLDDILFSLCLNKHPRIKTVDLRVSHAQMPGASFISAFHAAYPQADLYTN